MGTIYHLARAQNLLLELALRGADDSDEPWAPPQDKFAPPLVEVPSELLNSKGLLAQPTSVLASVSTNLKEKIEKSTDTSERAALIQEKDAAAEINVQFGLILDVVGYWQTALKSSVFLIYFHERLVRCIGKLEQKERIRTLSTVLARIVDLHGAGRTVLSDGDIGSLCSIVTRAFERIGFDKDTQPWSSIEAELISELGPAPIPRWREQDHFETAAQFFDRVISPIPFALRPTTTQLKVEQPKFLNALSAHCSNIKRGKQKPGVSEAYTAHFVSELLPIGQPKARAPTRRPK
jgi:hypothetical protein